MSSGRMTPSPINRIKKITLWQEGPDCPFTKYASRSLDRYPLVFTGHIWIGGLRELRKFNLMTDGVPYCELTGGGLERD